MGCFELHASLPIYYCYIRRIKREMQCHIEQSTGMETSKIIPIFLLYILLFSLIPLQIESSAKTEAETLVRWKNTLLSHDFLDSWNLDDHTNLCRWQGIVCNTESSTSEINLSHANINGTLQQLDFALVSNLTHFNLKNNNFSGFIPSTIGSLSKLTILDLSNNEFLGIIPLEIGNLTELRYINLYGNSLSGPVPYQISDLQKAWYLDFGLNILETPNWSKFQGFPLLTHLSFHSNNITLEFPDFILLCQNLTYLDLSRNYLTGEISKSLFSNQGKLRKLKDLRLQYNLLSGLIPDFFHLMPNLEILDLSKNSFSSPIPPTIRNLTKLKFLKLCSNNLTGTVPSEVGDLEKLQFLDLSGNHLSGQFPKTISKLSRLRVLTLSQNNFSGNILSFICNVSFLEYLFLDHNSLEGTIPNCFKNLISKGLKFLNLMNNHFHGTIPAISPKGCKLKHVILSKNQLKGSFPQTWINCKLLEVVDIGHNKISGPFPGWMVSLPELRVLILKFNKFHGRIPASSKARLPFSKLRILDISHNEFNGLLPIGYLEQFKAIMNVSEKEKEMEIYPYYTYPFTILLKEIELESILIRKTYTSIDLSHNKFQGEIPSSIGKLKFLRSLNLSYNNFTGHIPPSLENLTSLETLDLRSNQLAGQIPWQLTRLTFLSVLNLSYNHLVGSIPVQEQFLTFNNDSFVGNSELCGRPLTKICKNDEVQTKLPMLLGQDDEYDILDGFTWQVVLLGYGCGVLLGLVVGYVAFNYEKPKWFIEFVYGIYNIVRL